MAASKKPNYIEEELTWLRIQAEAIKKDVDSMPYDTIKDRIIFLEGPKGPFETIAQKEEQIKEARRKSLKDYFELIAAIDTKTAEEEKKKEVARGDKEIPHRMQK